MSTNSAFQKKVYWIILFAAILWIIPLTSVARAQPKTYTVVKGDTLWSICQKFYGNPDLWPTLWEMNPFVTNPHLLHPGDVITLLEKQPVKKKPQKVTPPAKKPEKPLPQGIDISVRTNPDAMGYFSMGKIGSWGSIIASENGLQLQYAGNIVYVKFVKGVKVQPGDEFTIFKPSSPIWDPLHKDQELGYIVRFQGKLVVKKFVGLAMKQGHLYQKPQIYKAKILNSYESIHVGEGLIPYNAVSPCVKPIHLYNNILGNIIGAKDGFTVIGTDSVVYIDKGFNQGMRRGELLQVVKPHLLPDTDVSRKDVLEPAPRIILPDIPVGLLMVVEARPNSSVCIVIQSKENIQYGYYVKTFDWDTIPGSLQRLEHCALD